MVKFYSKKSNENRRQTIINFYQLEVYQQHTPSFLLTYAELIKAYDVLPFVFIYGVSTFITQLKGCLLAVSIGNLTVALCLCIDARLLCDMT